VLREAFGYAYDEIRLGGLAIGFGSYTTLAVLTYPL
jgi:hypothetical protein